MLNGIEVPKPVFKLSDISLHPDRTLPRSKLARAGPVAEGLVRAFVISGFTMSLSSMVRQNMASRHLSYRGNIEASTLGDFIARIGTKRTQQPLTSRVSSHWIGPNSHFGSVTTKWLASTPAQQQGLLKNYVRDLYAEKEASLASSGFPRENVAFANSAVNDTGHFYERGGVYRVGPNTKKRLMDPRIGPIACYVRILSI